MSCCSCICRILFFVLNILSFLISILMLVVYSFSKVLPRASCDQFLFRHFCKAGLFFLVVSLIGMVAVCFRRRFILWLYLLVIIHQLFFTTVFVVEGLRGTGGVYNRFNMAEGEVYTVGYFTKAAQTKFLAGDAWDTYRQCLVEQSICEDFAEKTKGLTSKEIMINLDIQWGCCQPPFQCGYHQENATYWSIPATGFTSKNHDCLTFSNHENTWCFDCDSCKAGFLANKVAHWRKVTEIQTFSLILQVIAFILACCMCSCTSRKDKVVEGHSTETASVQSSSAPLRVNDTRAI